MKSTHCGKPIDGWRRAWRVAVVLAWLGIWGCARPTPVDTPNPNPAPPEAPATPAAIADACPEKRPAPVQLPGIEPQHRQLAYWLARVGEAHDLDEVLLTPGEIRNFDRALAQPRDGRTLGHQDLLAPLDPQAVQVKLKVNERLSWLHERLKSGAYVNERNERLSAAELTRFTPVDPWPPLRPALHVAVENVPVRCGPQRAGFYKPGVDLDFDRNNCSTIHPQEVVRVLAQWGDGMKLVRTRYTSGWIAGDAAISPSIPTAEAEAEAEAEAYVRAPRVRALKSLDLVADTGERAHVPRGTLLVPVDGQPNRVRFATTTGHFVSGRLDPAELATTQRPLTRRALLEEAFSYLDTPYGWGGQNGGRDCSRLMMDIFAAFDIKLPRFSGHQALSGGFSIDVSPVKSEHERALLIDAAARRGIVLLHFPGHIMLYLGRDEASRPMVLHSFAEYLVPCPADVVTRNAARETLYRVTGATVSDLELGRGSSRTAFIERLTRITVLGGAPGVELRGAAQLRPAAHVDVPEPEICKMSRTAPVWISPQSPRAGEPLRVIVSTESDPGRVELALVDPSGRAIASEVRRLGGPPYGYVAQLDRPEAGVWRAVLGDGASVLTCKRFRVGRRRSGSAGSGGSPTDGVPVWSVTDGWGRQTESFYALFVESLFDYPVDDNRTWTSLGLVLQDREHNLLHNYRGLGEDDALALQPDCADLPYVLRAYFAWKLGLPFGFRECTRGRVGRPTECAGLQTNLTRRPSSLASRPVAAFRNFARRKVMGGVHSSSARTRPDLDDTDFYPVPLTRSALRPGTTYADPYGHTLIIVGWVPQGITRYGLLMAADAQPDGTVGRRRFWRGSFLFTPDTTHVGAGFKAFRPIGWAPDTRPRQLGARDNAFLGKTARFPPHSRAQYQGTADDFYDAMEALINPRPLDPFVRQIALIEALHEVVQRRVTAVSNGEAFMAARRFAPITMPRGASIFLTSGPWEDFSTPSRDMRLLISIEVVRSFPERVRRTSERYGLRPGPALDQVIARLEAELDEGLGARSIEYRRSDGSTITLTLREVLARRQALEMAYNPNDCAEIRWGAAPGSDEMTPCARHAPAAQRRRMATYRGWFAKRERPIR